MNDKEMAQNEIPEGKIEVKYVDGSYRYFNADHPLEITRDMETISEPRGSRNDFLTTKLEAKQVELEYCDNDVFDVTKRLNGFRLTIKEDLIQTGGLNRVIYLVDGQQFYLQFIPLA